MLEGALRYLRGDLASLAPLAVQDPERTWARATTALHDGGEAQLRLLHGVPGQRREA